MSEELTQIRQILENNLQAQTDSRLSEITRIRQLISDFTQGGGSQIQFPLYLIGDETSDPRLFIGQFPLDPDSIPGIILYNDNIWRICAPGQIASLNPLTENVIYLNIDDSAAVISSRQTTPPIKSQATIDFFGFRYEYNNSEMFAAGQGTIGFFGENAAQQSITETTADAAIIELQNILIAYGLATDNR